MGNIRINVESGKLLKHVLKKQPGKGH